MPAFDSRYITASCSARRTCHVKRTRCKMISELNQQSKEENKLKSYRVTSSMEESARRCSYFRVFLCWGFQLFICWCIGVLGCSDVGPGASDVVCKFQGKKVHRVAYAVALVSIPNALWLVFVTHNRVLDQRTHPLAHITHTGGNTWRSKPELRTNNHHSHHSHHSYHSMCNNKMRYTKWGCSTGWVGDVLI